MGGDIVRRANLANESRVVTEGMPLVRLHVQRLQLRRLGLRSLRSRYIFTVRLCIGVCGSSSKAGLSFSRKLGGLVCCTGLGAEAARSVAKLNNKVFQLLDALLIVHAQLGKPVKLDQCGEQIADNLVVRLWQKGFERGNCALSSLSVQAIDFTTMLT